MSLGAMASHEPGLTSGNFRGVPLTRSARSRMGVVLFAPAWTAVQGQTGDGSLYNLK